MTIGKIRLHHACHDIKKNDHIIKKSTNTTATRPEVLQPVSVSTTKSHKYHFHSDVIDIKAPLDVVWDIVKKPNDYERLSHGAIRAQVEGDVAVGKKIRLLVYPDKLVGKIMGASDETITVVDENQRSIGWSRDVLCSMTARYHVLESLGPHLTRSYITLEIPSVAGALSAAFLRKTIERAFNELNHGIEQEALKRAHLIGA